MVEDAMTLTDLSTKDLIDGMTALLGTERQAVARLIAYLAEIDARGAHLDAAYTSLQDFCMRKLGLSEGEAFRRINAARLVRRFPVIVEMIETGSIHLTALVTLRDYLTDGNHLDLLRAAARKTKSELASLLATRFPRADLPPSIVAVRVAAGTAPTATAVHTAASAATHNPSASRTTPAAVEPLSATRFRVELTVDAALREKLERAARLMGHRPPEGLAAMMDRAVDLLIAALEKERFAKTDRPAKPRAAKHGHISRAVRREVWTRDEEQCSFVSEAGERCPARTHLQYDHRFPRALGGSGKTRNVRLLCRAHNLREAERVFGKEVVDERIRLRQRKHASAHERASASPLHHLEEQARTIAGAVQQTTSTPAPTDEGVQRPERMPLDLQTAKQDPTPLSPGPFEIAERALRTMGFRRSEAQAAVDEVREAQVEHWHGRTSAPAGEPFVVDVLRDALAVLHRDRMTSATLRRSKRSTHGTS